MKRVAGAPAVQAVGAGKAFEDPSFSQAVIRWQKQHGRHTLPWQNTTDAYRIWLSEIMLQQTQVSAVIPYYLRFLERFPDVAALAAAPSEEVMAHWSGLGYYSRARNLHRCAQRVMAEFGGIFPSDPELLADLPGIGRSTAAAIAAFAYGARAAILDGNVKRVFARVFGIEGFPGAKPVEDKMWLRAVALLPENDIESYTQGLMDLGATLCTRSSPSCNRCPLSERCVASETGRTHLLPERRPKKTVPEKSTTMLVITHDRHVLLEQRPDEGIWGGLMSLPEVGVGDVPGEVFASRFGEPESSEKLAPFSHVFTHFKLHISPYRVRLAQRSGLAGQSSHLWYSADRLADAPLPAPVKKLLLAVFREGDLLSR
ncbi:A/G-specific adenine glycosylase [Noviherbaspirillum denitrificans]|uniref:Adenine DNA glycosylase n=1 Tax=Noviherbaspirillum denitrificans TaxID=1968433 RepID=A0A254TD86_9BURK|nr:A/G-specific adenine glycosylase [Noviherbaspirillum denitrificans]OWW20616.1 A/G-specific adenine glycosylase [Noviherbaspirillum denitrificans]